MIKRILGIFGILMVLLLALAILVPYLFKDEIKTFILKEVNKDLDGELTIGDVNLSLIRSFPDLQVTLTDVNVQSSKDTTLPLFSTSRMSLDLNLMSVLKKSETVQINGFTLDKTHIYMHVDADGNANYDIYTADEEAVQNEATVDDAAFDLRVSKYSITDAQIKYLDDAGQSHMDITGLDHNGSGTYKGNLLNLSTNTKIDQLFVEQDGIAYIKGLPATGGVDVQYDLESGRIDLGKTDLLLDQLKLIAEGFMHFQEKGIEMDVNINAPENEFSQLWSIVPGTLKADYDDVNASGQFNLDGKIQGWHEYATGAMPNLLFNVKVDNGKVTYNQLPQNISNLQVDMTFEQKQGSQHQWLDVRKMQFEAGSSHFNTRAHISPGPQNVVFDGFADIDLQLKDLPLDGQYSGQVVSNLEFRGSTNDIDQSNYNKLFLVGNAQLNGVEVRQEGLPEVKVDIPEMTFSPREVIAKDIQMAIANSDISGEAHMENPLAFFSKETLPSVKLQTRSTLLDVNQMMPASEEKSLEAETSPVMTTPSLFPVDMEVVWTGQVDQFNYEDYVIKDWKGDVVTDGKNVNIKNGIFDYNGSHFSLDADLKNVAAYAYDAGPLSGTIDISGGTIDLNNFMTEETETSTGGQDQEMEVLVLPENMNIAILSNLEKVIYSNYTLDKLHGQLHLKDQTLDLSKVTAAFLGGEMQLAGLFKSDGKGKPIFNLKYDVLQMPFQGVAAQVKAIDQLVPISKYIEGIFNSTLTVEGVLGKGMFPDLSTLSAAGYIETLKGQLGKIPFMEKVSQWAAIQQLKGLTLENTKNWFEIKDGVFTIQPFDMTYEEMNFHVSGSTGLDKRVNFSIKAIVPKEKLDRLPGGAQVNQGIKWVTDEVQQRGLPFGEIKTYTLGIDVNGQVNDPSVKVKLLDFSKSGLASSLDEAKEQVKQKVIDTLQQKKEELISKAKGEAEQKINEVKDTLTKKIEKEVDKKINEVKDEAKNKVEEKAGQMADSLLNQQGKEAVDKIKDKLKTFDPFKKKK